MRKKLIADGKLIYELEIGDSPHTNPQIATEAALNALKEGHSHYGPAVGLTSFRQDASDYVNREFGLSTNVENIIAGPGAKTFQMLFCEAFVDPGEGVLVFSPYFPTYRPNIERRGARMVVAPFATSPRLSPRNCGD